MNKYRGQSEVNHKDNRCLAINSLATHKHYIFSGGMIYLFYLMMTMPTKAISYVYILCILDKASVEIKMNQSGVSFLDLLDEILLIILKKLDNMDVLYSLLDVDNQRLVTVVQDKISTNTLDFVLKTITDGVLSIANSILSQFCISITSKDSL